MKIWNEEEGRINGWTTAGAVLLVGLVILGIAFALTAATFGIRVATAGLVGRGEAHIQIQSASMRITAYNHFFDLCSSIQADEARIDALLEEQKFYTSGTRDFARVSASLTGVRSGRGESIAQYNADASKDYTIGQFRDSDLPWQITDTKYPEGGKTKCNFGN